MSYYSLKKRDEYLLKKEISREQLPPFALNPRLNDPELYRPSPELADAVNVALQLGLPLLLTGEPGSGKTQLAYHLAWYFNMGTPLIFNAQTTSSASDLFYQYDALRHFQYSQSSKEALSLEELERRFVRYKGLGEAIKSNQRRMVLIDEIDKAPRDLPNDVLDAIDKLRFYVPELDRWFESEPSYRPVIILTSNSEKNLPDAFLRRVVYFHIEFPGTAEMLEIVMAKVGGIQKEEVNHVIDHFYQIRHDRDIRLNKYPATAELLQWTAWLIDVGFPLRKLNAVSNLSSDHLRLLKTSYSVLAKTREDLSLLIRRLG